MVTKIYLIRHGETVDSHPKRYKGHTDVPLSAEGVRQLERMSAYLVKELYGRSSCNDGSNSSSGSRSSKGLKVVYCSDLERASRSAEIVARPFGLAPVIIKELRERSFGEWEGLTFDEIRDKWPDAFSNWANDPLRHSPPGGESTIEVRDRVVRGMKNILQREDGSKLGSAEEGNRNSGTSIAVVAHGGVNRVLLCEWLGMPLENIFHIEQDFGCLNIIEFHDGFPLVKQMNVSVKHG